MDNYVGKSIPRRDASSQIRGELIYGHDYLLPNSLYGVVIGSPYPHAVIKKVDISKALGYPGVKAIITANDIPQNSWGFTHDDQPVLCSDKVRRVGDPIVAIAADTEQIGYEASKFVDIEFEILPAVFDPIEALLPNAPKVHENGNLITTIQIKKGDLERGWDKSDYILEEEYRTQRTQHSHIEPRNTLVEFNDEGNYIVTSSSQRVFRMRYDISKILQIPEDYIIVKSPAVGGAFGAKTEISFEPLACLLAKKTGKPIKMNLSRKQEFTVSPIRHSIVARYKTGITRDGVMVARQITLYYDTGAYVGQGVGVVSKASINSNGPYEIENVEITGHLVYTNTNVGGAFRGFGVPQVAFAYESHTDSLAHKIGIDPITFRRINFLKHGSTLPTGQVIENPLAEETLLEALKLVDTNNT